MAGLQVLDPAVVSNGVYLSHVMFEYNDVGTGDLSEGRRRSAGGPTSDERTMDRSGPLER